MVGSHNPARGYRAPAETDAARAKLSHCRQRPPCLRQIYMCFLPSPCPDDLPVCHQLNFQEFFGFYAVFNNECEDASGSETYQEYFANGVGIALAAFFVIPSIRAETTKSPGVR